MTIYQLGIPLHLSFIWITCTELTTSDSWLLSLSMLQDHKNLALQTMTSTYVVKKFEYQRVCTHLPCMDNAEECEGVAKFKEE